MDSIYVQRVESGLNPIWWEIKPDAMGEWVVGENVGDYRLHSGETFPRLSPHMMVCRRGTLSPIVTIMGWSRVGGSVSTTIDCVGGKTSPPAVKRSVVAPFSLWWPNCALHLEHIGPIGLDHSGCTTTSGSAERSARSSKQTIPPRWSRQCVHRRVRIGHLVVHPHVHYNNL